MTEPPTKRGRLPRIIISCVVVFLVGLVVVVFVIGDVSAAQYEVIALVVSTAGTIAGALLAPANPGGADPMLDANHYGYSDGGAVPGTGYARDPAPPHEYGADEDYRS